MTTVVGPLDLKTRANRMGHAIVVVSELHPRVDWEEVWKELKKASQKTNYFFHVLDLQELQTLTLNAAGRPVLFDYFMLERWKRTARRRLAFTPF